MNGIDDFKDFFVLYHQHIADPVSKKHNTLDSLSNEEKSFIKNWLGLHADTISASPLLRDLSNQIQPINQLSKIYLTAKGSVHRAVNQIFGFLSSEDIEAKILENEIDGLIDHFLQNPQELLNNLDLIKLHLEMQTLKFSDVLKILSSVAPELKEIEIIPPPYSPFIEIEKPASLFRPFAQQLMTQAPCLTLEELQQLKIIINQDMNSSNSYLSNSELIKLVSEKNNNQQTVLHDSKALSSLLPLLLDKLGTDDLKKLLSKPDDSQQTSIDMMNAEFLTELSPVHLLQLTALFPQKLNNLPPDAKEFEKILTDPSNNIQQALEKIQSLNGLSEEEKDAAIADFIEFKKISFKKIQEFLPKEILLRLAPHLRYLDFRGLDDVNLAQAIIKNCSKPYHLSIDESRILKGIDELPLCEDLNCSNCMYLKSLPTLPLCKRLMCQDCKYLKSLPALPLCEDLNCSNCTYLKSLPALPLCNELDCFNCRNLKSLPELPLCKELKCTFCISLQSLPELLLCKKLKCAFCYGLESLPALPLCLWLDACECFNLTLISELSLCEYLNVPRCNNLRFLPPLPQCIYFDYSSCPLITELPELPPTAIVVSDSSLSYVSLDVDIEDLEKKPKAVLKKLGEFLLNGRPFPNIYYIQKGKRIEGIDIGGVRRDFVTKLCAYLKDYLSDYLSLNARPETFSADDEETFRIYGRLLALCYPKDSFFKTGPILSEEAYEWITAQGDPESDEWLLTTIFRLKGLSSNEMQIVNLDQPAPQLTAKECVKLAYLIDTALSDLSPYTQKYFEDPTNRIKLKNKLLEEARADFRLSAAQYVAKEIKKSLGLNVMKTLQEQGSIAFKESVEGILTTEALKKHIEWQIGTVSIENTVSIKNMDKTKQYLTHWINNQSKTQLEKFVLAITGNKTLTPQYKIQVLVFNRGSKRAPTARICSYTFEITGEYVDQESFNEKLEEFLVNALEGSGFQSA